MHYEYTQTNLTSQIIIRSLIFMYRQALTLEGVEGLL